MPASLIVRDMSDTWHNIVFVFWY